MLFHPAFLSALLLASAALPAAVSFESEVKPIFEKHCVECHGPKKQKSDFRLDDREVALHGGESHAPNIIPGKAAESPLLKFVTTDDRDTRMPPKGDRLSAAEIQELVEAVLKVSDERRKQIVLAFQERFSLPPDKKAADYIKTAAHRDFLMEQLNAVAA